MWDASQVPSITSQAPPGTSHMTSQVPLIKGSYVPHPTWGCSVCKVFLCRACFRMEDDDGKPCLIDNVSLQGLILLLHALPNSGQSANVLRVPLRRVWDGRV